MVRRGSRTILAIGLLVAVGAGVALAALGPHPPTDAPTQQPPEETGIAELTTFDSPAEFRAYVDRRRHSYSPRITVTGAPEPELARAVPTADGGEADGQPGGGPTRVGRTNVQVAGLDEPDRLKTDGHAFY